MPIDPILMPTAKSPIRDKVVTAKEAVRLVRDGDNLVLEGFAGQGFAEELVLALEERFLATGSPKDLSLVFTVAQGDRGERGTVHLCHDGMLKRAMGATTAWPRRCRSWRSPARSRPTTCRRA